MVNAVHLGSGKVRELYAVDDDRLLLVASDRISTFDVVLPSQIPDKGRVLTGLSAFWFVRTRAICPNHLLAVRADGRSTECRRLRMLPIECVVRGYLSGSGWKDYQASGEVCGHSLPGGLRESDRLPEPIFTPATKARAGMTRTSPVWRLPPSSAPSASPRSSVSRSGSTDSPRTTPSRAASSSPTRSSSSGWTGTGNSCWATRRCTPDSSRFWPADQYAPGRPQPSFDKQFVRDFCERTGWNKTYPGPELPADVIAGTRARYVEAFERLTGTAFDRYLADPQVVLERR